MAVQAPFDKLWGQGAHPVHTRGHLIIQLPTTENNWAVFTAKMQLKSSANIVRTSTSVCGLKENHHLQVLHPDSFIFMQPLEKSFFFFVLFIFLKKSSLHYYIDE